MREILSISLEATYSRSSGMSNMVDLRKYFVSPARREMKATLDVMADTTTSGLSVAYELMESPTTSSSDFVPVSQSAAFTTVTLANLPTMYHQEIHFQTLPTSLYVLGAATVAAHPAVAASIFVLKREA